MNIHQNNHAKHLFAIRDTDDGAIHSSRYYCFGDAMSAIHELAYELEVETEQLEVIKLIRNLK